MKLRVGDPAAKPGCVRFAVEGHRFSPDFFHNAVLDLITRHRVKDVCEAGGGANPLLSVAEVTDLRLNYTVADISAEEFEKADPAYKMVLCDIAGPKVPQPCSFDLLFSKMLAEHLRDGAAFHRNVFHMLKPNGLAFHFYPTLYSLPRTMNWLLPESVTSLHLSIFNPDRDLEGHQVKFPAYYSWCEGPTRRQIRRLESIGFEVLDFVGIFGHNGYYAHLPFMLNIHRKISAFLCRHEVAWQTSFACVLLRKPAT